jgi:prepilin-type N-terminal cleavage/methylation domain-containing protein
MKLNLKPRPAQAFTLIEMVGVIAVISLLAAILVPKVFAAIDEARYDQAITGLNTVKAATIGYFGKYGRFGERGGGVLTTSATNWDQVLVAEHFLDAPFTARVGDQASIQVFTVPTGGTPGVQGCFNLTGRLNDVFPAGSRVVAAVLANVAVTEAFELSRRIDGPNLSATNTAAADTLGRVTYPAGAGTVMVYLSHQ